MAFYLLEQLEILLGKLCQCLQGGVRSTEEKGSWGWRWSFLSLKAGEGGRRQQRESAPCRAASCLPCAGSRGRGGSWVTFPDWRALVRVRVSTLMQGVLAWLSATSGFAEAGFARVNPDRISLRQPSSLRQEGPSVKRRFRKDTLWKGRGGA